MFVLFWKIVDWLVSIGMIALSYLWVSKGYNVGYFILIGSILILVIKIKDWLKDKKNHK